MKILHKISINSSDLILNKLRAIGLGIEQSPIITTFDINEANAKWPAVEGIVSASQAVNLVYTLFTEKERLNAPFLWMSPAWHHGYPMPDLNFGYLQETYELSNYDKTTGIGCVQKAPFRMKGEPKWGKYHLLQLNWVFDVFFTTPETWASVFSPFGIQSRPVVNHATGTELKSVVQLLPKEATAANLKLNNQSFEYCEKFGIKKYHAPLRGFFPSFDVKCEGNFFTSREYFGSGASAWNAVMVSNALYNKITENKLKGAVFTPQSP